MTVIQNLKQSINRNVEAIMPQDDQKEEFTNALEEYYQKIAENQEQTEEFQKEYSVIFYKRLFLTNLSILAKE